MHINKFLFSYVLGVLTVATSCIAIAFTVIRNPDIIYGPDNKDSAAALPEIELVEIENEGYDLNYKRKLWEPLSLYAEDGRFGEVASPVGKIEVTWKIAATGMCTGVIVDKYTILTAAHCLKNPHNYPGATDEIESIRLIMGFHQEGQDQNNYTQNGSLRIFNLAPPEEVIKNETVDYAILRAEGNKTDNGDEIDPSDAWGRARISSQVLSHKSPVTPLIAIHHPEGLPKRITRFDCRTLWRRLGPDQSNASFPFTHHCDTTDGSSGGPIFHADKGLIVGIHKGRPHFQESSGQTEGGRSREAWSVFSAMSDILARSKILQDIVKKDTNSDSLNDITSIAEDYDYDSQIRQLQKTERVRFDQRILGYIQLSGFQPDEHVLCNGIRIEPQHVLMPRHCLTSLDDGVQLVQSTVTFNKVPVDEFCNCYWAGFETAEPDLKISAADEQIDYMRCRANFGVLGGDIYSAGWDAKLSEEFPDDKPCRRYTKRRDIRGNKRAELVPLPTHKPETFSFANSDPAVDSKRSDFVVLKIDLPKTTTAKPATVESAPLITAEMGMYSRAGEASYQVKFGPINLNDPYYLHYYGSSQDLNIIKCRVTKIEEVLISYTCAGAGSILGSSGGILTDQNGYFVAMHRSSRSGRDGIMEKQGVLFTAMDKELREQAGLDWLSLDGR